MITKYLFFIIALVVTQIEAMRKPVSQYGSTIQSTRSTVRPYQPRIQPSVSTTGSQVKSHTLKYFKTLGELETELNNIVDDATNYQTAWNHIHNKILSAFFREYITQKDTDELLDMFEKKLKDKFFPKRISYESSKKS
ncbi:MAG: hypothetical protein AMXMBFR12_08330 [Candidatus Babeliales bacterium]